MIEKDERDEIWKRNKPYLDDPETTEDIRPVCEKAGCLKVLSDECRGCPVCELWLSNEFLESYRSWSEGHDSNY